jgi:hypothetical protein
MRRPVLACCLLLPVLAVAAPPAGPRATGASLTVEQHAIRANCDHMPGRTNRQWLHTSVTLTNRTRGKLEARLGRVWVSFDPATAGEEVSGLSFRGADGRPSGKTSYVLGPGAEQRLALAGYGLFPEGKHGQTLYLTIEVTAGQDRLLVRESTRVSKSS